MITNSVKPIELENIEFRIRLFVHILENGKNVLRRRYFGGLI